VVRLTATTHAKVTGGTRGVAPKRYLEEPRFLAQLKPLFWANQEKEADAYDALIYRLHPPASAEEANRLLRFRGVGEMPALGKKENEQRVARILRTIRYPHVEMLQEAAGIEGVTLPRLTTILHFHHPAFPLYSKALVDGLNKIGIPAVYREEVSEESVLDYAGVIAALDRLKTDVTFENVPESNCFLTRVIEGALVEYAREG
jgi:hypothetical protein